MTLEKVFIDPITLNNIRKGPLSDHLDGFCNWLINHRYAKNTIQRHVSQLSRFRSYLQKQGISEATAIIREHIDEFLAEYLPRCKPRRSGLKIYSTELYSINRFIQYLKECGIVDVNKRNRTPYTYILEEYIRWMKDVKHSSPRTLETRCNYLVKFLIWLGLDVVSERISMLSPERIQGFFLDYASTSGQAARRSMQSTLRTFLRFCHFQGYMNRDLSGCVPTLRTYKLKSIPRAIDDKAAQNLLCSINRKTDSGRRDYAIIQLLYTYGIRNGQVRALHLDDINWRKNQIRFMALKGGKEVIQPLTNNVGEGLLDYLRNSRPQSSHSEVFLTLRAPYRPLHYSTTVAEIIARNIRKYGIQSPRCGAHAFRHHFATRMLEEGHPLKSIADMIGHRCIKTTSMYTKVDFQALNNIALDWPESAS